jgi:hypothetical protein
VRTQFKGAVIAVLEESLTVDAEEFFGTLDGDPTPDFGHGARKRVPLQGIDLQNFVKFLNLNFNFLLYLDTSVEKLKYINGN